MASDQTMLRELLNAIAAGDDETVRRLLGAARDLARSAVREGASRTASTEHFLSRIGHYIYTGDTALHVASAAYRSDLVQTLIGMGADVGARDRRGAQPLHCAAMGSPDGPAWNPEAQAATIACLIAAGADPNVGDRGGATPLHRAVRTRCSAAVQALLNGGADATRSNNSGSTPVTLATLTTGRGGSGSPKAKAEQARIVQLLEARK